MSTSPPKPGAAAVPAVDDASVTPGKSDATTMRREQIRGSAVLVVGRILSLLLTTVTQVVIVRALTQAEFGAFAYALAIAGAGRLLLSLGQGKLLSRFVAKYEEEQDYGRMVGSMVLAVATILLTSTVLLGTLFALPDSVVSSAVSDSATVTIVFILVFLAPLEALDQVFISLFAAFSSPGAIFFRKYLFTPGLRLAVVLVLVATGSSVTFLAVGYLGAGVVGLVVSGLVLIRVLRERDVLRHVRGNRVVLPFKAVFGFSVPLITGELFLLSINFGGIFILGFFHSAVQVALYRAVFSPARLNTAVLNAFTPMYLPLAARLHARGQIDELRRTYWQTAAFVAVLTFPVFALTAPLAEDLAVLLFGARYSESGLVLALLSVGYYVSVLLGFNTYTLQVCGRLRYLVVVNVVVAVLNVAVSLLLVERFAAVGVAAANLAALVVQNLLNQWALRKAIGTSFIDRSCLRCYASILIATAGLWIFQTLVDAPLVVDLGLALAASVFVVLASRNAIELAGTFPKLRRVPLLKWLVR